MLQLVPNSPIGAGTSPVALTTDPLGKFLFAANLQSNNVSAYSIDQATGELKAVAGSPFVAGKGPMSLAVDVSGNYLYVANSTDDNISGYSIDSTDGRLIPLAGFPVAARSNPTAVMTGTNGYVYVVNSGSDSLSLFQVNAATGALTAIGSGVSTAHEPSSVAEYAPGNFIYVTNRASNSISGFTRTAAGNLTELNGSPFPLYATTPSCSGDQPLRFAAEPQLPFAFVSFAQRLGTCSEVPIEAYQIDLPSGTLRNAASSPASGNVFSDHNPLWEWTLQSGSFMW